MIFGEGVRNINVLCHCPYENEVESGRKEEREGERLIERRKEEGRERERVTEIGGR